MIKIRRDQGLVHDEEFVDFLDFGPLDEAKSYFWAQGSVLTHDVENSTWLEEFVSENNIIQAQEE